METSNNGLKSSSLALRLTIILRKKLEETAKALLCEICVVSENDRAFSQLPVFSANDVIVSGISPRKDLDRRTLEQETIAIGNLVGSKTIGIVDFGATTIVDLEQKWRS